MSVVRNTEIHVKNTPVKVIDPIQAAHGEIQTPTSSEEDQEELSILQYDSTLGRVIGPSPTHSLLLSSASTTQNPFFHSACVYLAGSEELYTTSNLLQPARSSQYPTILISRIKLHRTTRLRGANDVLAVDWVKMRPPQNIHMPRGAVHYHNDSIVFCAQGTTTSPSGGLFHMPRAGPPVALVTNFYGRDLNSPSDAVVASDGAIWFTDPTSGFEMDLRPRPRLPPQVYRYDPKAGDLRVVANEIGNPTGLAFSPNESILYVTDADFVDPMTRLDRTGTIFAYDVQITSGSPFLINKRVFAYAAFGHPEGVKCDTDGNVYAGCRDGVEIWNSGGRLIGRVLVPGGVTRFCFGSQGEMFLCAEQRLWRLQLDLTLRCASANLIAS